MKKIAYFVVFVVFSILLWLGVAISRRSGDRLDTRETYTFQPTSISGEFCVTQGGELRISQRGSYCVIAGETKTAEEFFLENLSSKKNTSSRPVEVFPGN